MTAWSAMWGAVGSPAFRRGLLVSLCLGATVLCVPSCAPGDLRLVTEAQDDDGDSSGGASNGPDDEHQGGDSNEPSPPDPDEPKVVDYSCVVREDCEFFICDPAHSDCATCEDSGECNPLFPYCDSALDVCVECFDDEDCRERFGPSFEHCSAGRCVQCQRDSHCENNDCERGWCGKCDDNHDCDDDSFCYQEHCIPRSG